MSIEITTLFTLAGGIVVAGATYIFTKWREREAEWRREKREHYKAFILSLSEIIECEPTESGQRSFARACNNLNLIAPQAVLEAMQAFREEATSSGDKERQYQRLSKLLYHMRKDLKISPKDNDCTFQVYLWSSR